MKCTPPILFPELEYTAPESPCHKLGADYAVSMVGFISGDATYPLLIRTWCPKMAMYTVIPTGL